MARATELQETKAVRGIHWTRVQTFLSGYALVFKEATSSQRGRVVLVVFLSGVGAVLQGASLGVLGFFVNRMGEPQTLELPFGTFVVGENAPSIVLLSSSVFLLMVGTAAATYGAARLARAVGRNYQRQASRTILESLEQLGGSARRPGFSRDDAGLLAIRSTRIMGRGLQTTLQSLPSLAQLIVALGIAFHLDAGLTLGVAPLTLVLIPALYAFSGSVQRNSKAFFGVGIGQMSRRLRQLVGAIDASRVAHAPASVGDLYDADPQIERYLDLYDGQQLAVRRSNFITAIFRAVSILLLLVIAGYNALRGTFSWGELVAYVGAIGYALNNVQLLVGVFTQLNRFYPQVQKYVAWRRMTEAAEAAEAADVPLDGPVSDLTVRIPDDAAANAGGTVVVKPGAALSYWTPLVLGRLSFWEVVRPLLRGGSLPAGAWARSEFVGDAEYLGEASLEAQVFGEEGGANATRLAAWLGALGLADEVAAWPEGAAQPIDGRRFERASRELRAAVRILPLVASPAPLVLFTGSPLAETSEAFRRALLGLFEDRILIVVCRSATLPVPEIGTVVVSDGTRLVGSGSPQWFDEAPLVTSMRGVGDSSIFAEEDDDDGEM